MPGNDSVRAPALSRAALAIFSTLGALVLASCAGAGARPATGTRAEAPPTTVSSDIVISSGGTKPTAFHILARTAAPLPSPTPPVAPALLRVWDAIKVADAAMKALVARIRSMPSEEVRARKAEIRAKEAEVDALRRRAVEELEHFLREAPPGSRHIPDARFALAELSYELEESAYLRAVMAWDAALERGDPEPPDPDYSRTIEVLQSLLDEHPDYPGSDAVLYLLGYCLVEMDRIERGIVAWERLVATWPDSGLAGEVWLRLGDHRFDGPELGEAVDAYRRALDKLTSPHRVYAEYKLAWTHYRMDEYEAAISGFLRVADATGSTGEGSAASSSTDLRPEAVTYVAICLSEEAWGADAESGPGRSPPRRPSARLGVYVPASHPAAFDIHLETAETLVAMARYEEAAEVYRLMPERFPDHPRLPVVASRLTAVERHLEPERD